MIYKQKYEAMRKYLFLQAVFIFFFAASMLYGRDCSWYGGTARLAALGGVTTVLYDASAVLDLYSEGFASSLVLRREIKLISTAWGAMPHEYKTENSVFYTSLQDHPVFLYGKDDMSSGFTCFFDKNNVLQIKPFVMLNEGEYSMRDEGIKDYSASNSLENMYGAGIVYARRLNREFSGGAELRAAFFRDEAINDRSAYINYEDVRINSSDKIFYSKAEYSISGTYTPDAHTSAAFSFGTQKELFPYYQTWITALKNQGFDSAIEVYPALFSGYSYTRSLKEQTFAALWKSTVSTDEKYGTAGYDINAGCSVNGPGNSAFTVSAGVTVGLAGSYSVLSSTVLDMYYGTDSTSTNGQEYRNIQDGFGHHAAFKGRYDFDGITAGGKFVYYFAAADFHETGGGVVAVTLQTFDAVCGAVFLPDKLIIPVEIFAQSLLQQEKGGGENRDSNYAVFCTGLRGGVEYEISSGIFMRLGFDAAYGGPSSHVKSDGGVTDRMLGTYSNPAYVQTGISLGAGHRAENTEVNLNLRYSNTNLLPLNADLSDYKEASMTILTDIKFYL